MSQDGGSNTMVFITAMLFGLGIIVLTLQLSGALDAMGITFISDMYKK